jgi:hypothetical protein
MLLLLLLLMFMQGDFVCELQPLTGLLFIFLIKFECGEPRKNNIDRVTPNNFDKNKSHRYFLHQTPTQTDPAANQGLRDERPATNLMSRQALCLTFPTYS